MGGFTMRKYREDDPSNFFIGLVTACTIMLIIYGIIAVLIFA
jgi:hypothetical protein